MWKKFNELLPHVLHQIFSILSKTLTNHGTIGANITPRTRLADFEMYGETISQVLGYKPNEFLNLYHSKREEIALKDNDSYPIIRLIEYFMESRKQEPFEGLTSQLYCDLSSQTIHLNVDTKEKYSNWPKKSNHMVQQINKLQEQFRKIGYDISTTTYTKREPIYWHNRSVTKIAMMPQSLPNDPDHADHSDHTKIYEQNDALSGRDGIAEPNHSGNHSDQKPNDCTNWICTICHQDNLDLIQMNNPDTEGKTEHDHQDSGHKVMYFTKEQADEFAAGNI